MRYQVRLGRVCEKVGKEVLLRKHGFHIGMILRVRTVGLIAYGELQGLMKLFVMLVHPLRSFSQSDCRCFKMLEVVCHLGEPMMLRTVITRNLVW